MNCNSAVSSSSARMSGTKKNVLLSLLVVSMFLLASVAFVTDVSVADDRPKEVGAIHITEKGIEAKGWTEGTDYEYHVESGNRTLTLKGGSYIVAGDSAIDYQISGILTIALAGDVSIRCATGITGTTPMVIKGHGSLTMECSGPAFKDVFGLVIVPDENSEVEVNVNSTVVVFTSLTIRPGVTLKVGINDNKPAIECLKVMLYGNLFVRSTSDVPAINTTETDVLGGMLYVDSRGPCSNGEVVAADEKENIPFAYAHSGKSTFKSFSIRTAGITPFASKDGYNWQTLSDDLPLYIKIGVPVEDGYVLEQTEGGKISFLDQRIEDMNVFLVKEPVILKAVADRGFEFGEWSDGSTDYPNHLVFTSVDDNTYSATFVADPTFSGDSSSVPLTIVLILAILGIIVMAWKKD